jgi:probable rRNA maturation factor
MIELEIADSFPLDPVLLQHASLERAAQEALRYTSTSLDSGLTIMISDDAQLRQLNRQFLGIDEPTDVLSVPAGYVDPDTNTTYLGDIIVSYPRAAEQAAAAGHPAEEELRLLVVHGVLHLVGYDHAETEDQAEMWEAQEQILKLIRDA